MQSFSVVFLKWRTKLWYLLVVLLVLLTGCSAFSNQHTLRKQSQILFSQLSLQSEYGENAYQYLSFIHQYLGKREMGSQQEKNTAIFIFDALLAMGYTEDNIKFQPFAINQDPSSLEGDGFMTNDLLDKSQKDKSQNIILTIPGKSDKTVIVGAHYDSVNTQGVDDNGSGVSVLLESAFRRKGQESEYTIKYIFFGAEEVGTKGSKYYVKNLSDSEIKDIEFMINVDTVLAGDYRYVLGGIEQENGDTAQIKLLQSVYKTAQKNRLDVRLNATGARYPLYTGTQRSDHYAFASVGIPYVYFWADNLEKADAQETEKHGMIMHTQQDNLTDITKLFGEKGKETLYIYCSLLDYTLNAAPTLAK